MPPWKDFTMKATPRMRSSPSMASTSRWSAWMESGRGIASSQTRGCAPISTTLP